MPKFALLSVYDKTGIVEFAKELVSLGFTIISTGGTSKTLEEAGIKVTQASEITGTPEIFNGRIKTVSVKIEGGLLFDRKNPAHVKQAEELEIPSIDLVACNLYPFEQTISKEDVSFSDAIENIDVGGPTMVRSAAKNHQSVCVVVSPDDYQKVIEALKSDQLTDLKTELAAKAFEHLSFYDSQIASYLREKTEITYPSEITIPGRKIKELRYGENPHQSAALYLKPNTASPFNNIKHIAGRELSMMNVTDINAGLEAVRIFDTPAAVVIKHNTPCGIALGDTPSEALKRAIEADPESAFGGVVVFNKPFDKDSAEVVTSFKDERKGLFDIVAAPGIDDETQEILKGVRKSMGVYVLNGVSLPKDSDMNIKEVLGGFVLQTADWDTESGRTKWEVVTKIKPTDDQLKQMEIAWKLIRRMRSNTVIIMDKKLPMTRGIGTGQTSRYRAALMAIELAGKENCTGAVMASDAFFPFDDVVSLADKNKIGAIIQSGGSINDAMSIEAADKAGIPMVFTQERTFWHY